jgi:hypothetical protein
MPLVIPNYNTMPLVIPNYKVPVGEEAPFEGRPTGYRPKDT